MRFPSVPTLVQRAREVLVRFPWTMAAAIVAAVAAVVATTKSADEQWGRIAMVAALGFPLTVALTLLAEERAGPAAKMPRSMLQGSCSWFSSTRYGRGPNGSTS
jgi:small-conductance mechanosensitive channel